MSVRASASTLATALKELNMQWQETKSYWTDTKSISFERTYLEELPGVVTRVDWFNPHAHVFVDVKDEGGKVVNWDFELAGPNGLMRRGWRDRKSIRLNSSHRT